MLILLKAHVKGYTKKDGTVVRAHEDKRQAAAPQQASLSFREPTGGDQVRPFPYASGMSRRRDMEAAIESPAGLGTAVGELSSFGMDRIVEAIRRERKPVFVDSGAFNAFKSAMKRGKPEEARLAFGPVFAKYDELSRRVCEDVPYRDRNLLMMVAPDVVGDQVATLELIEQHAALITKWIDAGHEVIVPFQRGPINQQEALRRVTAALDGAAFVVGIPSAAAAMTSHDVHELLSGEVKPDRLHILGAVSSSKLEERMEVIRERYVDDVPGVTCDANVMRSKLYELGGLQGVEKFEKIKEILSRVVPERWGGTKPEAVMAKGGLDLEGGHVGFFTSSVRDVDFVARTWTPPTPAQAEAGNYFKPTVSWRGLTIKVENPAGSVRRGPGWVTHMVYDYGYISGTEGVDGDEVDVYLGPSLEFAPMVYVVHQRKKGAADAKRWAGYDEDKCMLGFLSEAQARAAYLRHYDDPRFLGPITAIPIEEFVAKVLATDGRPAMVKSLMFVQHVAPHVSGGHQVAGYDRKVEHAEPDAAAIAEYKARQAAREADRQRVRTHFQQFGDGFELRHTNGRQWAVMLPDASNEGKYRYQVFDQAGLRGHYTYNHREDAIDGAYDAGFREHDAGAMDRLAPIWAEKFSDPDVQAAASTSGEKADSDRTQPASQPA